MATDLQFIVVTGLSGAGKTLALDVFEDAGYFAVDNLPPELIATLVDLFRREGSKVDRVAVVCDARGGEYFDQVESMLGELHERDVDFSLVFLEASNEALVRRFKETRRRHPLSQDGSVLDAIREERRILAPLRECANLIIDTGDMTIQDLLSVPPANLGYWEGYYYDAGGNCSTTAFKFKQNGTYNYYRSNVLVDTGTYSLVQREPAIFSTKFKVTDTGGSLDGLLIETHSMFYMNTGPSSWPQVTYVYKPQGYVRNNLCP